MRKKIIFVVDMIKGFCKIGKLSSSNINELVPKIKNYLENNKKENIIFINDNHSEDDIEMQIYPVHCLKNSVESEIVDELRPYLKIIIPKNTTNSFFAINNKKIFEKFDNFEIIGCCTDICILQFALTLKTYLNFKKIDKDVIVYENLVDTFDSKDHNRIEYHDNAIKLMKNAGIKIKRT